MYGKCFRRDCTTPLMFSTLLKTSSANKQKNCHQTFIVFFRHFSLQRQFVNLNLSPGTHPCEIKAKFNGLKKKWWHFAYNWTGVCVRFREGHFNGLVPDRTRSRHDSLFLPWNYASRFTFSRLITLKNAYESWLAVKQPVCLDRKFKSIGKTSGRCLWIIQKLPAFCMQLTKGEIKYNSCFACQVKCGENWNPSLTEVVADWPITAFSHVLLECRGWIDFFVRFFLRSNNRRYAFINA